MDIYYKKNTLYVHLHEEISSNLINKLERRIDSIMSTYGIDNLVIDTDARKGEYFHEFENNYNKRHKTRVIIK